MSKKTDQRLDCLWDKYLINNETEKNCEKNERNYCQKCKCVTQVKMVAYQASIKADEGNRFWRTCAVCNTKLCG